MAWNSPGWIRGIGTALICAVGLRPEALGKCRPDSINCLGTALIGTVGFRLSCTISTLTLKGTLELP